MAPHRTGNVSMYDPKKHRTRQADSDPTGWRPISCPAHLVQPRISDWITTDEVAQLEAAAARRHRDAVRAFAAKAAREHCIPAPRETADRLLNGAVRPRLVLDHTAEDQETPR